MAVTCAPTFTIAGTLVGYGSSGLQLKNNTNAETITIPAGQTTFAFTKPVTQKLGYSISIAVNRQPPTSQAMGIVPCWSSRRLTA